MSHPHQTPTVLDRYNIQPSLDTAATAEEEVILRLTHLDIIWMYYHPSHRLLFFEFPCTKSHFLDILVPNLKKSLARTLACYLPLAGKIVIPDSSAMPFVRFVAGVDTVPLAVVESDKDFNHLVGNHPRAADDFYDCVPQLPPPEHSADGVSLSVLSVQATLFPGHGVCLGINNHHVIGDARCTVDFMKFWAAVNKSDGSNIIDGVCALPVFDRAGIKDPQGLTSLFWKFSNQPQPVKFPMLAFPLNKFRGTFVLKKDQIQKLKQFVVIQRPGLTHVTTFTVTCALFWVCLVKAEAAAAAAEETVPDGKIECMVFSADCRSRLNPPLPGTYFGNCVALVKAEFSHGLLKSEEGFTSAAEGLGEAIRATVYSEKGVLGDAGKWPEELEGLKGKRKVGVAGSPRFSMYEADFGWGRARKFETGAVDWDRSMSLSEAREAGGGLEIGFCAKKEIMDAFADIFGRTVRKYCLPKNE